jgi:L-ribulose-5-phosphate 4-epimerase
MATKSRALRALREEAYAATMALHSAGLVVGTFGNASAVDRAAGAVAIKPSGVAYDSLRPEDMVVVDLEGNVIEGNLRPSSDTKTHVRLYRAFEEIGGVAHTHSFFATAWAQAQKSIPCLGTTHADYFSGPVPVTAVISDAQIKLDYELETAEQVIEAFRKQKIDYRNMPAVLVAAHGPFSWGATGAEAAFHSEMLELVAEMAWLSLSIAPTAKGIKKSLLSKHYLRKHGRDAYYGQEQSALP